MIKHHHKIVFLSAIFALGTFFYFSDKSPEVLRASTGDNMSGWAWSSNIGWISFNCTNTNSCGASDYGVKINSSSGEFSGYAWSPNIGWISFNQADLTGCPSGVCGAEVTGGLAGAFPKSVTGWAKVLSTGGWVHLNGSGYGIQLESSGDFTGWAWEDQVVGWISLSGSGYSVRVGSLLPAAPALVDIKADNSDGPISVGSGTSVNFSWSSYNVTSCVASGSWSGVKAVSGSESTGPLTSSKTYILTCSGSGGESSDSVTINVLQPLNPSELREVRP